MQQPFCRQLQKISFPFNEVYTPPLKLNECKIADNAVILCRWYTISNRLASHLGGAFTQTLRNSRLLRVTHSINVFLKIFSLGFPPVFSLDLPGREQHDAATLFKVLAGTPLASCLKR